MSPFPKIIPKRFVSFKISSTFAALLKRKCRAFSSAGSEHLPYKQRVGGSNPSTPTTKTIRFRFGNIGRLAQLVQSICLTSRGSGVRIPQRPPRQEQTYFRYPRAFSSAGSEHLPYKQRVGGSNPSTPTNRISRKV